MTSEKETSSIKSSESSQNESNGKSCRSINSWDFMGEN